MQKTQNKNEDNLDFLMGESPDAVLQRNSELANNCTFEIKQQNNSANCDSCDTSVFTETETETDVNDLATNLVMNEIQFWKNLYFKQLEITNLISQNMKNNTQ